jgi:hypothetical protein
MRVPTGNVERIIEQVKSLPDDEQLQVAEVVDRLTWSRRWRRICERIEGRAAQSAPPTDAEIDAAVASVRKERPLSERSSTRRS